ncbi:DUF6879 family protein [Lentzea sp. NBRC 105346]|uniref:DUF6879 family protein n=1 Tax=Lentzea sp. NBRC 105346 TaxID=3032205 RepID=UPI002555709F|nr:DUF6879 family protein [Lentzea sp. NBRC 105346]
MLTRDEYVGRIDAAKWCFRLQVHPVYTVDYEQPEFRRYLETGTREIDPDSPWFGRIRRLVAAGGGFQRVYVIEPPLTDYQRYVFLSYHHYAQAGEDLRILDVSRTGNLGLPDYDFSLLDDEAVIKLYYSSDNGTPLERELLPDTALAQHRRYKELALNHSVPFLTYEETLDS